MEYYRIGEVVDVLVDDELVSGRIVDVEVTYILALEETPGYYVDRSESELREYNNV